LLDHVVIENRCQPNTAVYNELFKQLHIAGMLNQWQFENGIVEFPTTNAEESFAIILRGNAITSRKFFKSARPCLALLV
jgi:hypothetical protein